jgi:hypothetical protein
VSYDSEELVLDSCAILNGLFVNGAGVEKMTKSSCICDLAASGRQCVGGFAVVLIPYRT